MRILVINGSPHKGNTWAYYEEAKIAMQQNAQEEITFEEISLLKLNIPFCIGCEKCFREGESVCPHYEKIREVSHKIEISDGVIILCPTYSLGVSAVTKNLIDHMSYNYHRPRFFGKKVMIICTTLGKGAKECRKYLHDVFMFWGFNRTYNLDFAIASMPHLKPSTKTLERTRKRAIKFYKDISSNKMYRPSAKRVLYYNMWRSLSTLGRPEEDADNRYWLESGLREVPFDKRIPIWPWQALWGNAVYKIIGKIVRKSYQ